MQHQEAYTGIKSGLIEEFSKVKEQQKLLTIKRIANLPFLDKVRGINGLRQKINSVDEKNAKAGSRPETERSFKKKATVCTQPPYTFGSGIFYGHPVFANDPNQIFETI